MSQSPTETGNQANNDQANSDTSKKGQTDENKAPAPKIGKRTIIILVVAAAVLIVAGLVYYFATRNQESTDDAQIDGNAITMEAKVSGYVTQLDVADNQRVKAGQILFRIDPRDYIASRDQARGSLAQAKAQLENAQASFSMTRVSAPAKLLEAKAQAASATASLDYAASDMGRQTGVDRRATSQQNIDQAAQNLRTAKANVRNNQAQVQVAALIPQTLAQAKAQVDEAAAQVVQAQAQLNTAELNLSYTIVRAPESGWVTQRNIHLGSYVQAGESALSLVEPHVWVTANFKENQLDHMQRGQKVKIDVDAYPDLDLEGHIDGIQMGTGSRFSAFPAENATGNFVKVVQRVPVKIVIDKGLDPKISLPLGLSVNPTVYLK